MERRIIVRPNQEIQPFAGNIARPIRPASLIYECRAGISFVTPFRRDDERVLLDIDLKLSNDIEYSAAINVGEPENGYIVTGEDIDPDKRKAKLEEYVRNRSTEDDDKLLGFFGKLSEFRTSGYRFRRETIVSETELSVLQAIRCVAQTESGLFVAQFTDAELGGCLEDCLLMEFRPADMQDLADSNISGTGHPLRFSLDRPDVYQSLALTFMYDTNHPIIRS